MTVTAHHHPGLDDIDARRLITGELVDLLTSLDEDQPTGDCDGSRADSIEAALVDARSHLAELEPNADLLPGIAAVLDDVRRELARALDDLAPGCHHTCPPVPHDWPTADRLVTALFDRLGDAGYHIERGHR